MEKNKMKIIPITIGVAWLWCLLLTVILIFHLETKNKEERKIKNYFREEIKKECYVEGDKQMNFICDCFIEETLKHNNTNELLMKYNKGGFPIIEQITYDYFNVCLNKYTKAKRKGEI
ncbi:MAG: hypothetical protein UHK60_10025 [Acutalibacteraceae bacterium]|nr:hypothetical protein [Acutalibacteraceae bacterium]